MIGVLVKESEIEVVKELFELFKTPWELYQKKRSYDVIITTTNSCNDMRANLIVIY